jgi:hypothetical protein
MGDFVTSIVNLVLPRLKNLRLVFLVIGWIAAVWYLLRPESELYFMPLKHGFGATHPKGSYGVVAVLGATLFTAYWWFLGVVLPPNLKAEEQPQQQGETKKPASQDVKQESHGDKSPNVVGDHATFNYYETMSPKDIKELKDGMKKLLAEQQGKKANPDELQQKYPLGYIVFGTTGTNAVFPYESKELDRWDVDWTKFRMQDIGGTLTLTAPPMQLKTGPGPHIFGTTVTKPKALGPFTTLLVDERNNLVVSVDILAFDQTKVIFVLGFNRITG